jgi:hypothetical protein
VPALVATITEESCMQIERNSTACEKPPLQAKVRRLATINLQHKAAKFCLHATLEIQLFLPRQIIAEVFR